MFVSIGIDPDGGNSFSHIGTTQLLSVPYALLAEKSNIEPKIFVSNIPHAVIENLKVYNYGTQVFSDRYHYSWIQGDPETVYVEYQNIPFDFYFEVLSIDNYIVADKIKNFSGVDTIYDGLMRTSIHFIKADTSYIPKGTYPFQLIFRTKDHILDTLHRILVVKDTYYDDCYGDLPTTKNFLSTDCNEIEDSINQSITLEVESAEKLSISSLIGSNCNGYLSFYFNENCAYNLNFDGCLINSNVRISKVTKENENLIFDIELWDPNTGELHYCKITYE